MENAEKPYPLVSVIIPTYNRATLLQEAVSSVLAQNYRHFELIIADDGSTDNTGSLIKAVVDPRVKYFRYDHSGNPGITRNLGVKQASGEWLAFIDSDDLWLPGKLEKQVRAIQAEGMRWSFGGFTEIGKPKEPNPEDHLKSKELVKAILDNRVAAFVGTLVVHKDLYHSVGGFSEEDGIFLRDDFDLALRLALQSDPAVVPEIVTLVREHPDRSTGKLKAAHEKTHNVYQTFINSRPDPELMKVAKKRQAYLLSEAAANKKLSPGMAQRFNLLKRSFGNDKLAHWLHCLWRSAFR